MQYDLTTARRLVIKIGSALLVDAGNGLRQTWLDALVDDVAALKAAGQQVVIVSSGAVALGMQDLGDAFDRQRLRDSQAAAAIGQIKLAHAWQSAFATHDVQAAQILLTLDDTEIRRRYLNARETIETLLRLGVVPVINENDTVATSEIRYGDNDRLAARVAQMIGADGLVILSDVDGLYDTDPDSSADASFITHVPEITPDIEAMAGAARKVGVGSGGMITKIAAAKLAVPSGCHVLIVNGTAAHPVAQYRRTGRGTWFEATGEPATARKQWIAGSLSPSGVLVVDDGAAKALADGKSLLPAGVTDVKGDFERGDAVAVQDGAGHVLARGLVAYSSNDARTIMGHKSGDIEDLLGYRDRGELIHRDHLVLL